MLTAWDIYLRLDRSGNATSWHEFDSAGAPRIMKRGSEVVSESTQLEQSTSWWCMRARLECLSAGEVNRRLCTFEQRARPESQDYRLGLA